MPTIPTGTRRTIRKFCFTHGHGRNLLKFSSEEMPIPRMKTAVLSTSWYAQHEVWMGNTDNPGPILCCSDVLAYWIDLQKLAPQMKHSIAPKLTKNTTREMLLALWAIGVRVLKIYPEGVTHSEDGWSSIKDLYPIIQIALEIGFIIALHGEQPGGKIDTYAREVTFAQHTLRQLVNDFPGGRFNVEHISTRFMLEMVGEMPDWITGGLTLQHLIITRNDLLEWKTPKRTGLNPFNHFRPPAQTFEDREALQYAALHADESPYRKLSFGPDSAIHLDPTKLCDCGCPGALTAPVIGPMIVEFFEQHGRLNHPAFAAFTVENGARIYDVKIDDSKTFELVKEDWIVPASYGGGTPFFAGRTISWKPTEPAALDPELLLKND
jgi:dihydroorotase (homodimeric type)